jgi:protein archease
VAFRFLDHTADVAFEVTAASRDEVFAEALAALTETLTERERVEERLSRRFDLAAAAVDLLLVDWLGELVYAFEVEELLFRRAAARVSEENGGFRLVAEAWGEVRDEARHPIKVLIKAVTYHGLEVVETAAGWRARVVFDV